MLLTLQASFLVWMRVYFYAIIGTALSIAFFASPAKAYLIEKLNKRSGATGGLKRTHSQESLASREPILGLPPDPQKDLQEVVQEVKAEVEVRQRKGAKRAETVPIPSTKDM